MAFKPLLTSGESIKYFIECCGGPVKVAKALGVSRNCIYRWIYRGGFPRTEYTGETQYASKLARMSGFHMSVEDILKYCNPKNK